MYTKTVLPNGVRILAEQVPHVRSASVGIWVGCGSRFESEAENGISHFIEHMVFKGTSRRSNTQIAEEMDLLGGQFNAFTTKECTSFYFRALDENLPRAIDVLSDIFFDPRFDPEDLALERGVIYEEIDMYEDNPEDLVTELLFNGVYEGSALGMPVIGSKETLAEMDSAMLHEYMKRQYASEGTIVAISGHFEDSVLQQLKELFSRMPKSAAPGFQPASYKKVFLTRQKQIEQNHFYIGFEGCSVTAPERFSLQVLNNILGGGMSSRLFRKVREEAGLCYSIYTYTAPYADTGISGIYTALGSELQEKALALIFTELDHICNDGVSQEELDRCISQVTSSLLMGYESTMTRMNQLARAEMLFGRVMSADELLEQYHAVTRESVLDICRRVYDRGKMSFSAVGNELDETLYRKYLRN